MFRAFARYIGRTIYGRAGKFKAKQRVFGDGNFANIPTGTFRLYYRTSDNARYSIQPNDLKNIKFELNYKDADGGNQTLTVTAGLNRSIYNASESEDNDSIREKAPQVY